MAWRWPGNKPLSESMMFSLLMCICFTGPQSGNQLDQLDPWMKDGIQIIWLCTICSLQLQNVVSCHFLLCEQHFNLEMVYNFAALQCRKLRLKEYELFATPPIHYSLYISRPWVCRSTLSTVCIASSWVLHISAPSANCWVTKGLLSLLRSFSRLSKVW